MSPETLKLTSASTGTSGTAIGQTGGIVLPAEQMVGGAAEAPFLIRHYAAARTFANPDSPSSLVIEFGQSTRPVRFVSNVYLSLSGQDTFISSFRDTLDCVFRIEGRAEFRRTTIAEPVVEGPPRDSWTIPTWSVVVSKDSVDSGIVELAGIIEGIKQGLVPTRPLGLVELAKRAVKRSRETATENVEDWAERLARDFAGSGD